MADQDLADQDVPLEEDPEVVEAAGRKGQDETDAPDHAVRPPDDTPVVTRSARSLVWQAWIGTAFGVVGVLAALVFFLQAQDLRGEAAQREAVLEAGELVALRVTTFQGADIDAWVADTQALSTGTYAEEVATLFDAEIRAGLAEAEVESVGEVLSSFVQDIDDDEAMVFAVMRQTYTSAVQPTAISDELRMEIELEYVDGEWLASDVAVLGPSTIAPIEPSDDVGDPDEEE